MSTNSVRSRAIRTSATLLSGPIELLDFLVPLWAGAMLGLDAPAIGWLVAAELVVSVLVRPLAGYLADTRPRSRVAAFGAFAFSLSCVIYAVADTPITAFVAAVLGGVAGPLFWISLRAIAAEYLADESGTFAGLMSAEALGSWIFWGPAMVLLGAFGYPAVFIGLAVAAVAAGARLLLTPKEPLVVRAELVGGIPAHARRLAPLMTIGGFVTAAEAGVGLALLLQLQDAGLEVWQIALVYLPGGIALTLLPRPLHGVVERWGRKPAYVAASLASAASTAVLALAPPVILIAALWIITSASLALLYPLQKTLVTEASGERVARGMSLQANADTIGAAVGVVAVGAIVADGRWALAFIACALVVVGGAALAPWVIDSTGQERRERVARG
ncbi:MFS transporter [Herbiconiux sp. KACC 21604]|uniref:MFS transporter n=1 Tax=unclassified Herbiconiux TaxID=2618217 RepID=UPI0014910D89|nr:MFS transporter [Herbiconiux sp. SALV-R1]QJU54355.1 MFS transporter [Herbiconiux sp. SALV-R1]WPO85425.1 MFS transporter [Herbiconiux sp. KACC 21604]